MHKYKEAILYILLLIVVLVLIISKLKPVIVDTYNTVNDLNSKTAQSADLDRQLEQLKANEAQKMSLAGQAKNIYKPAEAGLDAESSFTVLFDDIIDMAKYNGIKIFSIQYTYNPTEDEVVKGAGTQYNVCQLDMDIISDYPDLESFLKEIYKYPYLININRFEMAPYEKNKKILLTKLQLKLYSSK